MEQTNSNNVFFLLFVENYKTLYTRTRELKQLLMPNEYIELNVVNNVPTHK